MNFDKSELFCVTIFFAGGMFVFFYMHIVLDITQRTSVLPAKLVDTAADGVAHDESSFSSCCSSSSMPASSVSSASSAGPFEMAAAGGGDR